MKRIHKYLIFGLIAIILAFFLDEVFDELIAYIRNYKPLLGFMHFLTNFGVILVIGLLFVGSLWKRQYKTLFGLAVCGALAFEIAFLLKPLFMVPRPYVMAYSEPIYLTGGYSFPSLHAAFLFALYPFIKSITRNKIYKYILYALVLTIAFSRIYLNVHFVSDVLAGGLLGLLITKLYLDIDEKFGFVSYLKRKLTDKFEIRRQSAHVVIGLSIVLFIQLDLLNTFLLFMITIFGGIIVLFTRKYYVPGIHELLEFFERPKHRESFPGRGSFFMVLGCALSMLFFEENIALAAIMVMTIGDVLTNIIGRHFGKLQNPFNRKKTIEGTLFGILGGTLGAFYFIPLWPAFVGSVVSMFLESLDLGFKHYDIDDNLVIPLVAGGVMSLVM